MIKRKAVAAMEIFLVAAVTLTEAQNVIAADHQYGHYGAAIDYLLKTRGPVYDWHRNEKPLDEDGYSTDLIPEGQRMKSRRQFLE